MIERHYIFHEDPGHGWLQVPYSELVELGIAFRISGCSYRLRDWCFLEEDCDAPLFLEALKERGILYNFVNRVYPRDPAPIRNYPNYWH